MLGCHLIYFSIDPVLLDRSQHSCSKIHGSHERESRGRSTTKFATFYTHSLTAFQVILETEYDNAAALSLYESLGFIREKRLFRFYLNGKDAFRLVLEIPVSDDDDEFQSDKSESLSSPRLPPYRAIQISPYSDDDDDESSR